MILAVSVFIFVYICPGESAQAKAAFSKLLAELQNEKYANIRQGIMRLVGQVGDKEPISFLVTQLQSDNRRRRCDAGLALELLGDRRGVPAIIKELNDTSYRPTTMIRSDGTEYQEGQVRSDRYYAALLLGILGDKRAVPALIEATKDDAIDYCAATSLGAIGDKRAIPALHGMLERCVNDTFSCLFAGYGLAMLGDKEGLKVVIDTLNDRRVNWGNRDHAIYALGKLGDKEAVPYLVAALKDEHPNIRVSAARALGKIGDVSALPALVEALKDKTQTKWHAPTTVSEAAAKAIDRIKAGGKKAELEVEVEKASKKSFSKKIIMEFSQAIVESIYDEIVKIEAEYPELQGFADDAELSRPQYHDVFLDFRRVDIFPDKSGRGKEIQERCRIGVFIEGKKFRYRRTLTAEEIQRGYHRNYQYLSNLDVEILEVVYTHSNELEEKILRIISANLRPLKELDEERAGVEVEKR